MATRCASVLTSIAACLPALLLGACRSDPILDAPQGTVLASDGKVAVPVEASSSTLANSGAKSQAQPSGTVTGNDAAAAQGTPASATILALSTPEPDPTKLPPIGQSVRLAGDPAIVATPVRVKRSSGEISTFYRSGQQIVNENLPEGYPAPTPPGVIELKSYPTVRRAEFRGDGISRGAANGGFWPLFSHIQRRDIAMTSPVEMDYRGLELPEGDPTTPAGDVSSDGWTMSFLYRTAQLGPTGEDGKVVIVDAPPVTVISVGTLGTPGRGVLETGTQRLREYFATQDVWEPAGDVRAMFYNGPDVPRDRSWSEVQVPVRRKPKTGG